MGKGKNVQNTKKATVVFQQQLMGTLTRCASGCGQSLGIATDFACSYDVGYEGKDQG